MFNNADFQMFNPPPMQMPQKIRDLQPAYPSWRQQDVTSRNLLYARSHSSAFNGS